MFDKVKKWFKTPAGIIIPSIGMLLLALFLKNEYIYLPLCAFSILYIIICSIYAAFSLESEIKIEKEEETTEEKKPRATEWVYISKHDGEEYHITIFYDETNETYRVADLDTKNLFDESFKTIEEVSEWINEQSDYIMGLTIYKRSFRDELEKMVNDDVTKKYNSDEK